MTWLPGWAFRKRIIIPSVHVDSNLVDFPFYVPIDADADFHEARADGFDIRFTLSDGTTLLEYEREHWAGGNGSPAIAHLWVKVPSILASGGAIIYVYYGKRDAPDGEDAPNVWDANFKGVWHMKDITPSTVADSTGVNDGAKLAANEPIEADGKVYKGQEFDSVNDKVGCGNHISLNITEKITIEAWLKYTNLTQSSAIVAGKGNRTDLTKMAYWLEAYYAAIYFEVVNTVGARSLCWFNGLDTNLHYIVGVMDGIKAYIYVDTDLKGSDDWVGGDIQTVPENFEMGRLGIALTSFGGLIDELRVSNIVRLPAWRKFTHRNINEADNEITWGIEEAVARGVQASREEPELLLTGIPKDIIFIGKEKPVFISKK